MRATSSIAARLMLLAGLLATAWAEAPAEPDKGLLLRSIQQYRSALAAGLTVAYDIQVWADDEDRCSMTWRFDGAVKGRFHRFSWRLASQSPNIKAHHQEQALRFPVEKPCATAFNQARIEWLDRTLGAMTIYTFSEDERARIAKGRIGDKPEEISGLLRKYTRNIGVHQLAPFLMPLINISDNPAFGNPLTSGGFSTMFDEDWLQAELRKFSIVASTATRVEWATEGESESAFAKRSSLTADYLNAHTTDEIAKAKTELYDRMANPSAFLVLERIGDRWLIRQTGFKRHAVVIDQIEFDYDARAVPISCRICYPDQGKMVVQVLFSLVAMGARVADADLAIDVSEARTIHDDATGMSIEPAH